MSSSASFLRRLSTSVSSFLIFSWSAPYFFSFSISSLNLLESASLLSVIYFNCAALSLSYFYKSLICSSNFGLSDSNTINDCIYLVLESKSTNKAYIWVSLSPKSLHFFSSSFSSCGSRWPELAIRVHNITLCKYNF